LLVALGVTVVYVPRRFPLRRIRSAGSVDEWFVFDCRWTADAEDVDALNK
jgi:hypothetical protein